MTKGLLCLIGLFLFLTGVHVRTEDSAEHIVFFGTVEAIAPDTGIVSGDLAIYRPTKYRVERLCHGEYKKEEIVVDHLILTGKELEGVKVGDRVCVSVKKSKIVFARFNAEGIRKSSEVVKVFFVGGQVTNCGPARDCGCCQGKDR